MRKLLNTVYVTNENSYLSLDGENIVCKVDGEIKLRVPFDNIENIVCFSYVGCSPALMGKCVSISIPINFVTPQGKFLAKVCGGTQGNVFLRVAQIERFKEDTLKLAQNTVAAKFSNTCQLIRRSLHDNEKLRDNKEIKGCIESLKSDVDAVYASSTIEELLGIEGSGARKYFEIFDQLITNDKVNMKFDGRSKHPPLDPVNAVLSFAYTLLTNDCASALETVGLDSYIGYYHSLRSGRESLACDLVEEIRCIAERFVLSLLNLRIITEDDFEKQISGAVFLNEQGRKKFLMKWQEKKRDTFMHPYIKEKIAYGLLPYVQSNLLARYVRGDIDEYPCYLQK